MIFLDVIFNISCCYFQHSLLTRKKFNSILIRYLWNVLHATLVTVAIATATSATKKASKQNKLNQLCLQLSTRKTVLLLALLVSI